MTFDELQTLTEKNTKAITDLIVVARANLDTTTNLQNTVGGLQSIVGDLARQLAAFAKAAEERSRELDERMNALIHTVDDLVRDRWRRKNGDGHKEKTEE